MAVPGKWRKYAPPRAPALRQVAKETTKRFDTEGEISFSLPSEQPAIRLAISILPQDNTTVHRKIIADLSPTNLRPTLMKLARSGYYKNKGITTLASTTLKAVKPGYRGGPIWNPKTWEMFLRIKGVEGQSTYDYDLHLSGDEIAMMIENSLIGASDNVAVHAEAKAISAYIREVLDSKHKPQTTG